VRYAGLVTVAVLLAFLSFGTVCAAGDLLDCVYVEKGPQGMQDVHPGCARLVNGQLHIEKASLARMWFDETGLAWLLVSGQHYYVKPDGSTLAVIAYDNGPDYFAEDLVRSRVNGKIAYYDRSFRQVIPPRYDWGTPFLNGLAWVCHGCAPGPRDDEGHVQMMGGLWGGIDKMGKEVVPVTLTRAEIDERNRQ
jgi:hypothetical protein